MTSGQTVRHTEGRVKPCPRDTSSDALCDGTLTKTHEPMPSHGIPTGWRCSCGSRVISDSPRPHYVERSHYVEGTYCWDCGMDVTA